MTRPTPPRITIVGAGNPLLACDRVGPEVLDRIAGRYGPEVELCSVGAAGLALLDHLHGQELLVVIDACVGAGDPERVRVVEPDLERPAARETSVHQIGPFETLAAARHLYPTLMPRAIRFILVETDDMDAHAEEAACLRVVSLLDRELARLEPPAADACSREA